MTKKCYKCNSIKELKEFSKKKARKDGFSAQCKKCHSKLRRKHYIKNKEKILKQVKIQKEHYQSWARTLKDKPCADCNIKYPFYVMQFDHIDPKLKSFNISEMISRAWNKQSVLDEISKCDVVCANCHFERTYQRNKTQD